MAPATKVSTAVNAREGNERRVRRTTKGTSITHLHVNKFLANEHNKKRALESKELSTKFELR